MSEQDKARELAVRIQDELFDMGSWEINKTPSQFLDDCTTRIREAVRPLVEAASNVDELYDIKALREALKGWKR